MYNKNSSTIVNRTNLSATSLLIPSVDNNFSRVLVEIVYVVIFVLGTVGNVAMIFLLRRRSRRRRQSPSNRLLVHVVISEMSVLLLNIPIDIALIHVGHRWIFGPTMCKILWPLQTLSFGSFVWILTLLSYQRYRGIVCPLEGKLSTKRVNSMVSIVWLFSLVVVIPYGAFLDYQGDDCIETWNQFTRKCFTVIFFIVQYALPLAITLYCYVKIAIVVRKGHTNVRRHISGSIQAESRHKQRNFSAIRTAVLFTVIFAVCMFPHQALWLWLEFGNYQGDIRHVLTFAYMFTFTSVFMNPLVYILSTPSVRKEFCLKASVLRMGSCSGSHFERRFLKKRSSTNSGTGESIV
ncbi:putative neuropeptide Y receptor type 6 [Exaiptasia diaphana]|uniref:G-protein coupled receptors family 1 profile domain-containing protein n=1 Tax=Exaiptasia diaphana TaxID=2652724 RepID=A0A913XLL4_EXADI|nr:putative neuropeptide Y receptor type 6 [Exaiptasia diaphana]